MTNPGLATLTPSPPDLSAWAIHDEFAAMRARFHRALAVSLGAHALLAAALLLAQTARPRLPEIIEVTWLEPAPAAPAAQDAQATAPAASVEPLRAAERAAPAPRPAPGPAASARPRAGRPEQLVEPAASRHDLVTALPVAPASSATRAALATAPAPDVGLARAAAATMLPVADRGRPVSLARGPQARGPALALTRGPVAAGGAAAALAATALPAAAGQGRSGGADRSAGASRAATVDGAAGAAAGDILLEGPAAGREVRHRVLPAYPDWAQARAVEAVVTLSFAVLPDGQVREDVAVERTGGFRDFDESALAALRGWRFAPLDGGDAAGQWGTITFRFRLRG